MIFVPIFIFLVFCVTTSICIIQIQQSQPTLHWMINNGIKNPHAIIIPGDQNAVQLRVEENADYYTIRCNSTYPDQICRHMFKNELTKQLVQYMKMPMDSLARVSGHSTPERYLWNLWQSSGDLSEDSPSTMVRMCDDNSVKTPPHNTLAFYGPDNSVCELEITVKANRNTYDITYTDVTKEECTKALHLHPLYDIPDATLDGEIVHKNDLTKQMIRFLTMPNCELELVCGRSTPIAYKSNIMRMLTLFWD